MKQLKLNSKTLSSVAGGLGGGIEINGEALMNSWIALQLVLHASKPSEQKPTELVAMYKAVKSDLMH